MQQNGRMPRSPRESSVQARLWRGAPVVLAALQTVGYAVGVAIADDGADAEAISFSHGWIPIVFLGAQTILLVFRYRAPVITLIAVAALDAAALLVTSGELGTGSFAVMIAVYSFTRQRRTPRSYLLPAGLAVGSIVVAAVASQTSAEIAAEWTIPFAVLRGVLAFGLPIVIAEVVDGRERLVDALRERAEAAERERSRGVLDAIQRERASMARELHDIAAHHLTGIIVSAQAAQTLVPERPEQAIDYMRSVQRDAQQTLTNLRQTVGILRTESQDVLAPVPSIEQLSALVGEASASGSRVRFTETGTPRSLGPLAGIAVYRMVQESLSNAGRHAEGAEREVVVDYGAQQLQVTVRNGPGARTPTVASRTRDGYGLIGMRERAELIGATLRTGAQADGGWQNVLTVSYDGEAE